MIFGLALPAFPRSAGIYTIYSVVAVKRGPSEGFIVALMMPVPAFAVPCRSRGLGGTLWPTQRGEDSPS